jgi:hypothetical protein
MAGKLKGPSRDPASDEGKGELLRFSMLNDAWTVHGERDFESPDQEGRREQFLIFSDTFKNGSIEAEISPLASLGSRWNQEPALEATIVFRYSGNEAYYYAGMGAWGKKFFIGKAIPGEFWMHLASAGDVKTIRINPATSYRLRIECLGSRISLFENDVRLLEVYDEAYQSGQWGLRTYQARARFANVALRASPPQCFVVMPFSPTLSFVYDTIYEVVTSYGIKCIRGDEIAVSRPIIDDIRAQISSADLLIVDFTGKNPNVYFEAGLADTWKKPWIILAQSTEDLSFDVRHIRTIVYSDKMGADVLLQEQLRKAVRETMGLSEVDEKMSPRQSRSNTRRRRLP